MDRDRRLDVVDVVADSGKLLGNAERLGLCLPERFLLFAQLIFDLLEHEGLCLGGSSGINIAGAIRLAKDLGPGKTIVTILADYGTRYQSKLFNPAFLKSKNLPVPDWLDKPRAELPKMFVDPPKT